MCLVLRCRVGLPVEHSFSLNVLNVHFSCTDEEMSDQRDGIGTGDYHVVAIPTALQEGTHSAGSLSSVIQIGAF